MLRIGIPMKVLRRNDDAMDTSAPLSTNAGIHPKQKTPNPKQF
jgi:hypothetical protein